MSAFRAMTVGEFVGMSLINSTEFYEFVDCSGETIAGVVDTPGMGVSGYVPNTYLGCVLSHAWVGKRLHLDEEAVIESIFPYVKTIQTDDGNEFEVRVFAVNLNVWIVKKFNNAENGSVNALR